MSWSDVCTCAARTKREVPAVLREHLVEILFAAADRELERRRGRLKAWCVHERDVLAEDRDFLRARRARLREDRSCERRAPCARARARYSHLGVWRVVVIEDVLSAAAAAAAERPQLAAGRLDRRETVLAVAPAVVRLRRPERVAVRRGVPPVVLVRVVQVHDRGRQRRQAPT